MLVNRRLDPNTHWESVDHDMAEILRQKTGAERLAIAFRMWRFALRMVNRAVKQQHQDWTEEQIRDEVARRMSHGAFSSTVCMTSTTTLTDKN